MTGQNAPEWATDGRQAMSQLASLFPTLATAPGLKPWNPCQFVRWAAMHGHCSGSAHAVRFLLSVWNAAADWRQLLKEADASEGDPLMLQTLQEVRKAAAANLTEMLQRKPTPAQVNKAVDEWLELFGPFNLADAVAVWDRKHRAAVSAWITNPFWP